MSRNNKIEYGDSFWKRLNEDIPKREIIVPDPDVGRFTFDRMDITFDTMLRTFDEK